MKTVFNKKFLSLFVIAVFTSFTFVSAQEHKSAELAFNFSFFNLFDSEKATDTESDILGEGGIFTKVLGDKETETQTVELAVADKVTKNSCEYYDSITDNLLTLETAGANAKEKIENVEETIEKEASVRDSIFYSVKKLVGLQKTDKVIFREMRKDIEDAKTYYSNLDKKVTDTNNFLSENTCEKIKAEEAQKLDSDTSDLVQDEATFRKQFAASLKEKLKILQDGVKEAKK